MSERVTRGNLKIAKELFDFVESSALPGTGIDPAVFWEDFSRLAFAFHRHNQALLEFRDELQNKIDGYHIGRDGQRHDPAHYKQFLTEIGYLEPEPRKPVTISTPDVDPEIASIAGPQLVVPVLNARFALNAANARWGSLYDAFYGTNIIPESPGREKGDSYNPLRGELVVARVAEELDRIVPLNQGSHSDATAYVLQGQELKIQTKNGDTELHEPSQFVGYRTNNTGELSVVLLKNNDLHLEIHIDREHDVGAAHPAGISDVVFESAITTIQDCEDSVAAVDAEDKTAVYRNWLGLMRGDLTESFEKGGTTITRRLAPDRTYSSPEGGEITLPGRSLLLVRNVGLLMQNDAIILSASGFDDSDEDEEIFEGVMDAVLTSLCAIHDLKHLGSVQNSRTGSVYIVKPKLHGPDETAFTCDLFSAVEAITGMDQGTLKIGVMDEERRTSLNLQQCIAYAAERIVFINTGFLDRTGDELHTSMNAGAMMRKEDMKQAGWILAYEDRNVDSGLQTGFPGRAQIGKGMWPKPDEMADMLETKIGHPKAGATCAWVPSPTAATLHALHYHYESVKSIQQDLAKREPATIDQILEIPLAAGQNFSAEEVKAELNNNIQGILGYVVRWVDQGVGCSKVPDINDIGLMEDRATCRISSQHVTNWLKHGLVSEAEVESALQNMAAVVDEQNADDDEYTNMSPNFADSIAFQAARSLIFEGLTQPNGYTEPILHRSRRAVKAAQSN